MRVFTRELLLLPDVLVMVVELYWVTSPRDLYLLSRLNIPWSYD
jgi:hypothetical protein